jgi:hypothetical protein
MSQEDNGAPPAMAVVVETLRVAIESQAARRDQLATELEQVRRELTKYQKALALIDEAALPPAAPKKKPGPKGPSGTKISPERVAEIEKVIRDWVAEHGDVRFRQVDIRDAMPSMTSGVSSFAFAALRDSGVLRIAGQEGNNRYYRLTHPALAGSTEE